MGRRGRGRFFLHPFDLHGTHFELWDLGNGIENRIGEDIRTILQKVKRHKDHLLIDGGGDLNFG